MLFKLFKVSKDHTFESFIISMPTNTKSMSQKLVF